MTYLRRTNGASLFALVAALVTASDRAEALRPEPVPPFTLTGQCFRSVDIAADFDSYFVAAVVGPCDGTGSFTVRLARYSANTMSMAGFIDAFGPTEAITSESLVRVSVARGLVYVVVANPDGGPSRLVMKSFFANLTSPMPLGSTRTSARVSALSLDCDASLSGSPCVVAAIEETGFGSRAFVRDGVMTTANSGPHAPIAGEQALGIAAIAGAFPVRGGVFTTSRPSVFYAASVPSLSVSIEPVPATGLFSAVSALSFNDGRIGAVWSAGLSIVFGFGPSWSMLSYRRMTSSSMMLTAFTAEDAVQVGSTVLAVGRGARGSAGFNGAGAAFAVFPVVAGSAALVISPISAAPIGAVRVASPNSCRAAGRAAAAFASNSTGFTGPNQLNLVSFSCSERTDCVDVTGTMGTCSAGGQCLFMTGPCAPDSGVDSGVDASGLRDTGVDTGVNVSMDSGVVDRDSGFAPRDTGVPIDTGVSDVVTVDRLPIDEGVLDAPIGTDVPEPIDADNDGGRDGSTSSGDAGPRPPTINGGACQCRAPAAPSQHRPHGALVLAAIASIVTVARRRSRAR
jgi:MYXO-CTERM domain-containing protein